MFDKHTNVLYTKCVFRLEVIIISTYIKGTYSRSIYQSNTGYIIGIFKVRDTNNEKLSDYIGRSITFTGYFHELNNTDTYMFYGELVNHEKYGEQFQVNSYERCKPEEKDSIIEFLTGGLFKGIGKKKAENIVNALGKDTLKVILNNPEDLLLIQGITKKNANLLHEKLKEYESSYETIIYLTDKGFSTRDAMLIYNTYKNKTNDVIEENIYRLIKDINEITFKKVDVIALKNGISKDDKRRVKASIIYIMNEVSNAYGDSYYFKKDLAILIPRVLGVHIDEDIFDNSIKELELDLDIVIKSDRYYLKDMYDAECNIVKRLRMLNSNKEITDKNIDITINDLEEYYDIKYNKDQLEAIKKAYKRDFLIITGGPGTGKTTIMKAIVELYRMMNKLSYEKLISKIALLAPTGRAAKRISEATLFNASTIHRFLKWNRDTNKFQVNEYNKSKVEFVIIDESSMIDTYLMDALIKGLSSSCKIVMIGDDHQLPSVGPGQVLHDLIESKMLEVVELKELYRQGKDSNIISLAYDIRNKNINKEIFNKDDDLTFIECADNEVIDNICEIATTYIDLNYKNFQILAPMYKGLNGIDEINKKVQEIYNPKDNIKKEQNQGEVIFRENDKVIQLTNMPDDNVYNGDIGLINKINLSPKKEIYIDFDSNIVKYTPANYINFRLAYSISIHKSQGSEFDIVVMPIVKGYNKMLYQKLIYTAVTRAKKRLYIIGDINALDKASKNTNSDIRKTTIMKYLIEGIE